MIISLFAPGQSCLHQVNGDKKAFVQPILDKMTFYAVIILHYFLKFDIIMFLFIPLQSCWHQVNSDKKAFGATSNRQSDNILNLHFMLFSNTFTHPLVHTLSSLNRRAIQKKHIFGNKHQRNYMVSCTIDNSSLPEGGYNLHFDSA